MAILVVACMGGYGFFHDVFVDEPVAIMGTGRNVTVTVTSSMDRMDIAGLMEENGLTKSKYIFYAQEKLFTGDTSPIIPGTYTFNTTMNAQDILYILTTPEQERTEEETEEIEIKEEGE